MSLGSLFLLLLTPLWAAVLHAVVSRIIRLPSPQRLAVGVGIFTAVLVMGLVTLRDAGGVGELLFSLFVAGLLSHVYFHLFNMSETARRIRLLVDLREGGAGPLAEYHPENMIRIRLSRLRGLGQADWIHGRYIARNSWLLWTATAFHWHERLLFPARKSTIARPTRA